MGGAALLLAIALAGAGLWWWAGQATSLATVLQRAAQWLPAGQSLQSRDVTGSLRSGGRIGWLRWSSQSLVVDVTGCPGGLATAPAAAAAAGAARHPRGAHPPHPLEHDQPRPTPAAAELVLPLTVDWASGRPIAVGRQPGLASPGLAGTYRFDGQDHRLTISNLALAQGRYTASAVLQARAPWPCRPRWTAPSPTPAGPHGGIHRCCTGACRRHPGHRGCAVEPGSQPAASGRHASPRHRPCCKGSPAARVPAPAPAAMRATAQATVRPWAHSRWSKPVPPSKP